MCSKKPKPLHVDGDVERGQFDNLYVDNNAIDGLGGPVANANRVNCEKLSKPLKPVLVK